MAKAQLKGALNALMTEQEPVEQQAKPAKKEAVSKTVETRATFIVEVEKLDKLKDIAFNHQVLIKDIVDSAFDRYIIAYEKKHGEITKRPEEKKLPI